MRFNAISGTTMLLVMLPVFGFAKSGSSPCGDIPLLKASMSRLPAAQRFPCDSEHVVVIRDIQDFLRTHPEISARADLRWKAEHAMAFTVGPVWPVYINLSSHRTLADAYQRGLDWVACVFAGVLAHERVHATGTISESAGLAAEFELDSRFRAEGRLPVEFDLQGLERQCREAKELERQAK